MPPVHQFGQREVVAPAGARPGVERGAEAGGRRIAAVDRDQENVRPAGGVFGVHVAAALEHLVLHRDGGQLAGAHAEERGARRLFAGRLEGQFLADPADAEQRFDRPVQVALP